MANGILYRRTQKQYAKAEKAADILSPPAESFAKKEPGVQSAETQIGRPGIVHRLDKDTSGVIIAAYDDEALAFLASQFKHRRTRKPMSPLSGEGFPSPGGR